MEICLGGIDRGLTVRIAYSIGSVLVAPFRWFGGPLQGFHEPFDARQQFRHAHAQPARYYHCCSKRQIVLASLDATHIRSMQTAMIRKRLLRESLL